ncbi:MAG TPA: type II secretion system F family protein, partial [Parcubacteria group bacterium]|nr:type II secretion system F family protein [Parcubacteria group bacterium]
MLYTYTAKNAKGEVYTGDFEAKSKIEVYTKVRDEGGRVLGVREKGYVNLNLSLDSMFSRINSRDKIVFAKNLSSMLSAGLSVTRALEVMEKQARKNALKKLLHDLAQDVSKGIPFSEALRKKPKVFPPIFVSMALAGEESGNLSDSLGVIASQMEKSYTLTKRVKGAMIYPVVILSLMVVISILLLIYMVPTLTSTFSGLGVELPITTRAIIAASDFMIRHTLIFIATIILSIVLVFAFARSKAGGRLLESLFLKLPVVGLIIMEVNSARTARTMSSLLSAGVPIVNALEVTESVVPNHLYKIALIDARNSIQKGETISTVLARYEKIYPPFITEMTAVGEETGKISEMLLNVALFYEEDVDDKT